MYRCIAVGIALMPTIAAFPATQKSPPQTAASVKLWVDTGSGSPCEQSNPASGDWMIRNNEDRNVLVTVHRILTKGGATREDQMRDTLGPRESRELGCEISEDGRQTLTVVRAIF
jgi:hypothetical protein